MKKKYWKLIMQIEDKNSTPKFNTEYIFNNIRSFRKISLSNIQNKYHNQVSPYWYLDQEVISYRIQKYINIKRDLKLLKRRYTGKRLDRSLNSFAWYYYLWDFGEVTDSHLFHENLFINKWHLIDSLLQKLFEKKIYRILINYYNEYLTIKNSLNY